MTTARSSISVLVLGVCSILALWGIYLSHIDVFPPFIDETVHIHTSEHILAARRPLEGVNLGRQFTIWLYALFAPAASDPIWLARTVTVLVWLPGVAGAAALARALGGWTAAFFTWLLLIFSAYHLFFVRLALADVVAGSAVLVAIAVCARLHWRNRSRDATLAGLLLFTAFGAKINALPYLGVMVAAALALKPASAACRANLRWLAVGLAVSLGLIALFTGLLRARGLDYVSNSLSLAVSGRAALDLSILFDLTRVFGNAGFALEALGAYLSALPLALLIGSAALLPRAVASSQGKSKNGLAYYLLLCLTAPTLLLWINLPQEMRFYLVPATLLLVCGAAVISAIVASSRVRFVIAGFAIVVWSASIGLSVWFNSVADPAVLARAEADRQQYVLSDATGFGFEEIEAVLAGRPVTRVIGLLPNCQGLRYFLSPVYSVECPQLRPDGQDIDAAYALLVSNQAAGMIAVLEQIPYGPADSPGRLIDSVANPDGRPRFRIYDLAPSQTP
ncbi:MAG: hypothetical protein SNJ59_05670 [Aggregatilineales bacterium]